MNRFKNIPKHDPLWLICHYILTIFTLLFLIACPQGSEAQILAESHFDVEPTCSSPGLPSVSSCIGNTAGDGLEGWSFPSFHIYTFWQTSGRDGLTDGYMRFIDPANTGSGDVFAPSDFHGDWSALDGTGQLCYDFKVFQTDTSSTPGAPYTVTIFGFDASGAPMSATWEGASPLGPTAWMTIIVPIDQAAWGVADPADWASLLSDVKGMHISLELFNNSAINDERTGLDDVILMQGRDPNCEANSLIEVPVDIKPTSCRNPLSTRKRGKLPVALLGTATFDVLEVDRSTVRLAGIKPIRFSLEDVATPYVPYLGKADPFDCTTDGPDGYDDLTFKFNHRKVINALGSVSDGEVLVLPLTAQLYDGTLIEGEDVIVILD